MIYFVCVILDKNR